MYFSVVGEEKEKGKKKKERTQHTFHEQEEKKNWSEMSYYMLFICKHYAEAKARDLDRRGTIIDNRTTDETK